MAGREYRLSKHSLEVGLVAVAIFGVMGIVSVTAAILNPDGSFRHPVAAAVAFGILWSCFVLLGVWLILIYARHRLFVDPTTVRVTGCFVSRQVSLAKVTHAAWKSFNKHGTLVLKEPSRVVKIGFGNYTFQERLELIRFFRGGIGWRRRGLGEI